MLSSVPALVDALRQHRLLDAAQLGEVGRELTPRFALPLDLARELLRREWLTAYQVNQLMQGRGHELVRGSYILLERLGEGGMGQVYKAKHWKLERVVALKLIRKERLGNSEVMRRFLREIRAAAQLDHPHVVRAYDAEEVDGTYLLAMEFVAGTDLAKLVKQCGPLSVSQACEYVRQGALGLQHAHERGLVHRDVKPSNLLLTADGSTVKLLDLGLARLTTTDLGSETTPLSVEGKLMGTPDYMAPEQAADCTRADARADVYSLGCTLYNLLTGHPPFPDGTLTQKLAMQMYGQPVPIESLRSDLPAGLPGVLGKMLAKRPEQRYQTAAEAAQALAEIHRAWEGILAETTRLSPPQQAPGTTEPFGQLMSKDAAALVISPQSSRQPARRLRVLLACGVAIVVVALLGWFLAPRHHTPATDEPESSLSLDEKREAALKRLVERERDRRADREQLRADVRKFRQDHPGTAQAVRAVSLLARLPSPLDQLDPARIKPFERKVAGLGDPTKAPAELVGVFGDHLFKHGTAVLSVAFSPDGRRIVSYNDGAAGRVWDASTGEQLHYLLGPGILWSVCFSPDGKLIASGGSDAAVRVWDAVTGSKRFLLDGHKDAVRTIAFSPDGKKLASGDSAGKVILWDVAANSKPLVLGEHKGAVVGVAFGPASKAPARAGLLASAGADGTLKVWDLGDGQERFSFPAKDRLFSCVAFSPDGKLLATGDQANAVILWDVERRREFATCPGHEANVAGVAFGRDGKLLASASWDNTVRLWDLSGGPSSGSFPCTAVLRGHAGHVNAVSFDGSGERLASASDDTTVKVWDVRSKREALERDGHGGVVLGAALSPDGTLLASAGADRTVRLWKASTGEFLKALKGHTGPVYSVAFSPDGRFLASAGADLTVRLWDLVTGKESALTGHGNWIYRVCFSPDGKLLASSSADCTVRLWDLSTRETVHTLRGHKATVDCVTFSPDGRRLASASSDGTIRLWEVRTGRRLRTLKGHSNGTYGVDYSLDGSWLASAGNDGMVRVWQADTGTELFSKRHDGPVSRVGFSPDGKRLASGNRYGRVCLWVPNSGEERHSWQLPGAISALFFADDGRHLIVAAEGAVYVLRLAPLPASPAP